MSKKKKYLIEFTFVNIGFFIASMGITNFLKPAKFTAGGFTGLAILIDLFSNLSTGQAMLMLNIPVFILAAFIFGKKYAIATIYPIVLFPFYMKFTHQYLQFNTHITNEFIFKLVAVVGGAICIGIGIGLAIAFGSNTGGTDIIGQIINKFFKFSVGNAMLVADSIIILICAFFLGFDTAVYAVICSLLIGKTVNLTINKAKEFQDNLLYIV